MEPYILTEEDIALLSGQGFDMRGVSAGAEATAREASILRGPVSTTDIPTPESLPYDPSSDPSAVMPVSSTSPAPVTFVGEDGTRSTVPSPSDIPQALPPAAAEAGATMRAPGTTAPLANFGLPSGMQMPIGGGFNPMAGQGIAQSTDPFEGLSRNQRMMLGFAALRDAAASLEGRDTSFFNDQLGMYESARDRERLRVQGAMQNRAQAINSLLPVFQQMQALQEAGMEIPDYLRQIVAQTYAAFGMGDPSTTAAMPTGVPATPTAPTVTPTAPTAEGEPTPQPTPTSRVERLRAENQADQELLRRASSDAARESIQARIDSRNTEIAQLEGEVAAASEAASLTLPQIDTALNYLVEGYDEDGNPLFRPELRYRLGRAGLEALQGPEYMQFLGALQTLKSNILIEGLQQATFGALSAAEQQAVEALQGSLDPANPIGSYETLIRLRALTQQIIDRHSGNQGGGTEAPASSGSGRINWDG